MSGAAIGIGTSRASLRRSQRTQSILIHIVLIAGAIVVMIPLAWMLSTSLKAPHQITKFPPIWIPDPFAWSNYIRAVTIFPVSFLVFIRNSMYMSLMIHAGNGSLQRHRCLRLRAFTVSRQPGPVHHRIEYDDAAPAGNDDPAVYTVFQDWLDQLVQPSDRPAFLCQRLLHLFAAPVLFDDPAGAGRRGAD